MLKIYNGKIRVSAYPELTLKLGLRSGESFLTMSPDHSESARGHDSCHSLSIGTRMLEYWTLTRLRRPNGRAKLADGIVGEKR